MRREEKKQRKNRRRRRRERREWVKLSRLSAHSPRTSPTEKKRERENWRESMKKKKKLLLSFSSSLSSTDRLVALIQLSCLFSPFLLFLSVLPPILSVGSHPSTNDEDLEEGASSGKQREKEEGRVLLTARIQTRRAIEPLIIPATDSRA